ncbi:MAG: ABC transporter ATP-binding protein [Alphaproteobacteria bacterium]|nr:ABC transporter ATP-binding protein [Alphaproteobacteria bacterium]
MILTSKSIVVRRGDAPSLHFPDLSISPGAQLLLLGPSGSGKTTLLSVLAGLLPPSEGDVLLEQQNFYAQSSVARDSIRGKTFGFIFQTLHLLPSLTLSQNVMLAADMAKVDVEPGRLEDLLAKLGLADKANRKPAALSQGEQQRVAIARAVLLRPKLLIADEPTSALDDANTEAVVTLLQDQAAETGAALMIATHDARLLDRFDTVVTLMTKGGPVS